MHPIRNLFLEILCLVTVVAVLSPVRAQTGPSNVALTRHNLTASGPGPVKTSIVVEPCVF